MLVAAGRCWSKVKPIFPPRRYFTCTVLARAPSRERDGGGVVPSPSPLARLKVGRLAPQFSTCGPPEPGQMERILLRRQQPKSNQLGSRPLEVAEASGGTRGGEVYSPCLGKSHHPLARNARWEAGDWSSARRNHQPT